MPNNEAAFPCSSPTCMSESPNEDSRVSDFGQSGQPAPRPEMVSFPTSSSSPPHSRSLQSLFDILAEAVEVVRENFRPPLNNTDDTTADEVLPPDEQEQ